jgi:hypothetical protein
MTTRTQFYVIEQLGPRRAKTPEGYLVCYDVPIARTGPQEYHAMELGLAGDGFDGVVMVERDPEEVFRPETIASFAGKDITDDHPSGGHVGPHNWSQLSKGVVLNPRRGSAEMADLLLADLLIKDPIMIGDIESGKREVSCGYDTDYQLLTEDGRWVDVTALRPGVDRVEGGRGRQANIIGNHVALVDRGRCGPSCSIGDRAIITLDSFKPQEGRDMRTLDKKSDKKIKRSVLDAIKKALGTKTLPALDAVAEPEGETGHEVHIHMGGEHHEAADAAPKWFKDWETEHKKEQDKRFGTFDAAIKDLRKKLGDKAAMTDEEKAEFERSEKAEADRARAGDEGAILGEFELEAPPGTGDKAKTATDSVYLQDAFQETAAMAEILAPGIRIPAFDVKAPPRRMFDTAICGLRRSALELAWNKAETRGVIEDVTGHRELNVKSATCDQVRTWFKAAAGIVRRINNKDMMGAPAMTMSEAGSGGGLGIRGPIKTPADLNKRLRAKFRPDPIPVTVKA